MRGWQDRGAARRALMLVLVLMLATLWSGAVQAGPFSCAIASVSGISRKDLLDLPLTLPSLEEQVLFGRIHQLQVEHAHITGEINRRYADLIQSRLTRLSN